MSPALRAHFHANRKPHRPPRLNRSPLVPARLPLPQPLRGSFIPALRAQLHDKWSRPVQTAAHAYLQPLSGAFLVLYFCVPGETPVLCSCHAPRQAPGHPKGRPFCPLMRSNHSLAKQPRREATPEPQRGVSRRYRVAPARRSLVGAAKAAPPSPLRALRGSTHPLNPKPPNLGGPLRRFPFSSRPRAARPSTTSLKK